MTAGGGGRGREATTESLGPAGALRCPEKLGSVFPAEPFPPSGPSAAP